MTVRALRRGTMATSRVVAPAGPQFRVGQGYGVSYGHPSFAVPAAVELGDLMIVAAVSPQGSNFTGTTGWTLERQAFNSGANLLRLNVYSRVADSTDAAGTTYSWSLSPGSNFWGLALTAWSGASAVDVHAGAGGTTLDTSLVAPTITPTVPSTETIQIYAGSATGADAAVITVPTTERAKPPTESGEMTYRLRQGSAPQAAAAATGTKTATSSHSVGWAAVHLAVKA